MIWIAIYGFACAVVAYLSRRDTAALLATTVLMAGWAIYNVSHALGQPKIWPAIDALSVIVFAELWRSVRRGWLISLVLVTLCQLVAHVLFWGEGNTDHSAWATYITTLNILFIGQLLCVLGERARRDGTKLFNWLSDVGGGLRRPGHSSLPSRCKEE